MTVNTIDCRGSAREVNIVPSASQNTAQTVVYQLEGHPADISGMTVTVDVTAFTTAASITVLVLGVDKTSGKTWTIATMAAVTTVSTATVRIHPNNATAALTGGVQTVQGQIPPTVQISVQQGNANATTFSVGATFE